MDLEKLEAVARAASPGPWIGDRIDGSVKYDLLDANKESVICGDNGNSDGEGYGIMSDADEAYFLAAHPAAVLELIALVRKQEAELAEVRRVPAVTRTEIARAIWNRRRIHTDCEQYALEEMQAVHPVWAEADAVMAVLTAPAAPAPAQQDSERDARAEHAVASCGDHAQPGAAGLHAVRLSGPHARRLPDDRYFTNEETSMNQHKQLAIQALGQMKGDDLYRARAAFRGLTPAQMHEQHGQSGKTRAQILDEYEAYNAKVDAAIRWVDAQN